MELNKPIMDYQELKEIQVDKTETVAEEIKTFTGLDVRVVRNNIELDTLAGKIKYRVTKESVMYNVYRFINHYGNKLHYWGLKNQVQELNK